MKVVTGPMPILQWMMLWSMHLCPVKDTLASLPVAYPAGMPVAACTNYMCGSYWNAEARWFAWRGWMGASCHSFLTSRNYYFEAWAMQVNPPKICPWLMWTLAMQYPMFPPPPEQEIHLAWISGDQQSSYSGLPPLPHTLPCNTSLPRHSHH